MGGRTRRLGARHRGDVASSAIAQPRPLASRAAAASREGTQVQILLRSRPTNSPAPRAVGPGAVGPLVRGRNADHL
jgi:hypothetical protein